MSVSYKRTHKGQYRDWLPEIDDWDLGEHWGHHRWPRFYDLTDEKKVEWLRKNPHRVKDVDDCFIVDYAKNPSHWNHDFSTVPRRAQERILIRKVLKDEVDLDDLVWPHGKKPVSYYW